MYAIVEQGGKQEKVSVGDCINIELVNVPEDAKTIELNKVLFINDGKQVKIGTPYIEGATVTASFSGTAKDAVVRGKKLYPTHLRRRKNSKNRIGHRQNYLQVTIEQIQS